MVFPAVLRAFPRGHLDDKRGGKVKGDFVQVRHTAWSLFAGSQQLVEGARKIIGS